MDEALSNLIEKQRHAKTRAENPYKKGTKAYELYEGNPYTREKFTRKKTGWDSFINAWGGRSAYDAALEDWDTRAAEWDAQIVSTKAEDEYNTDSAKAARMREAGLNPDLLGTQNASEAAEFTEPESPDVNAPGDSEEKIFGLVQGLGQAMTAVIGMGGQIQQVIGMGIENSGKEIKQIEDFVLNFIPDTLIGENEGDKEKYDFGGALETLQKQAEMWAKSQGWNKRRVARFSNNVRSYAESNKGKVYEKWTGNLQAKKDFSQKMNNKYTTTSDDVKEVVKIYGALGQDITDAETYQIKALRNMNKYNSDYYATKNGSVIAEGENAEAKAKTLKADLQQKIRQSIDDAVKKLGTLAEKGNVFAALLEGIIPGVYLKFME